MRRLSHRFEHEHFEAAFNQFMGGTHAPNAAPQDDDPTRHTAHAGVADSGHAKAVRGKNTTLNGLKSRDFKDAT
jgi:hypothetical protein